jgi:hypothetical protein
VCSRHVDRERWYQCIAADQEIHSAAAVFERLATASVAARVFGPNSPFPFPHAPLALERIKVYNKDGNSSIFTAECGAHFLCFRFFTS